MGMCESWKQEAVLSGDYADNSIVVCVVKEVKFPISDDGGIASFISLTQGDESEGDVWSVTSVPEGDWGKSVSIRDPNVKVSLADCFKSSALLFDASIICSVVSSTPFIVTVAYVAGRTML